MHGLSHKYALVGFAIGSTHTCIIDRRRRMMSNTYKGRFK
jgi:hypothetical protein